MTRDACRALRRRPSARRATAPKTLRHVRSALLRPPSAARGGRERAEPHLASKRRGHGQGLRCRHNQLPAASGDRASLQRQDDFQDEARRLYREHGARKNLRPRRIVRALESGQLAGYAGDVWFPQPPPKDHPWRTMPHHGMTPHISGTSLSAQARYAAGTREILECYFEGRPIRDEYLIVDKGKLAGVGAHSYSAGNATGGSEEAAKFKKSVRTRAGAALVTVPFPPLCGKRRDVPAAPPVPALALRLQTVEPLRKSPLQALSLS